MKKKILQAGEVVCHHNFLKSENVGITCLHKDLYKSLLMVEDIR